MRIQASHQARPVFIVGSPRSGTSVLTWALGQHPNLLLTEESNWLGSFAVASAAAYARGSARGPRSQLGALGVAPDAFLSGLGDAIDRMILAGRPHLEATCREAAVLAPAQASPEFGISRDPAEAKSRWVDGTPEYALQIRELLALFPAARFVHILRDADEVAASLVAFRDERGDPFVGSADEAYAYWLRTERACIEAEAVLGPEVMHRVLHAELVVDGGRAMRAVLDFLGEPFAPACLEPLRRRINSSFAGAAPPRLAPRTRSAAIDEARRASAAWLASPQPAQGEHAARARWYAEFDASVRYARELQGNWEAAQRLLKVTRATLDVCGAVLLGNWLFAVALWLQAGGGTRRWHLMALATVALAVYAWLRRAGLRALGSRVAGRVLHAPKARLKPVPH